MATQPAAAELKPGTVVSEKDAYRASTGRIVLHYGEGINRVELAASSLNKDGYPAIALAGGPAGKVKVWVARRSAGEYDRDGLYSGAALGTAANIYKELIGPPNPPVKEPPPEPEHP